MAIIYIDRFETTLTAGISAGAAALPISEAAADILREASGAPVALWGDQQLMRVPMYLDDGTNIERVDVPIPPMPDVPVPVIRGSGAFAFASGTVLRASPSAEHVAQGHERQRYVAGNAAMAIPGEFVNWAPGFGVPSVTLLLPQLYNASTYDVLFKGESWPAQVLVTGNYYGARTIHVVDYSGANPMPVRVSGLVGAVTSFDIPAGTTMALLTLRRVSTDLRGNGSWLVTMELFG
jgi:hypothetical protein